jgi:prophage antirepressor-like protein
MHISANSAARIVRLSAEQILLKQVQPVKMKRKGTPVYPRGEAERERKMTPTAIAKISDFEEREITTMSYRGKPAWIAREIGEAIGYSQGGKRFATSITGEWAGEFIEGLDYVLLTGKELADFKVIFELGTSPVPSHAPQIMLLFESGLYLALAKTNKPIGKRLRRFLAEEVLPQIARDGSYLPESQVQDGQIGARNSSAVDARIAREQRLARQLEFRAIKELVKTLRATGKCNENVLINHEIAAAEAATGMNLSELKPWLSPSEIADEFGVSPLRIGLTVTKLGIRGDIKGIARPVVEGRAIKGYLYSPRAVQQIADQLAYERHIPRRADRFFLRNEDFSTWRCRRCGSLLGITDGKRVEFQGSEGVQYFAGLPAICICECDTINELRTSTQSSGTASPKAVQQLAGGGRSPLRLV